jgi:hypothetical protein
VLPLPAKRRLIESTAIRLQRLVKGLTSQAEVLVRQSVRMCMCGPMLTGDQACDLPFSLVVDICSSLSLGTVSCPHSSTAVQADRLRQAVTRSEPSPTEPASSAGC